MNRRALLLVVPVILGACATEAPKKVASVQEGRVETPATFSAEPEPAPTTTTTAGPEEFHVGDTAEFDSGVRVVLYSIYDGIKHELWEADPGTRFMAIDVEGCAGPEAAHFNPMDFEFQMADNTRLEPTIGVREPALDYADVLPGDCLRGWVTFQVPNGSGPAAVMYEGAGYPRPIVKWLP